MKILNSRYWILDAGYWLLITGFWVLGSGFWVVQSSGELKIIVNNIKPVEGELYIAIYDHEDTYMAIERTAFRKIIPVKSDSEIIIFADIPEGEYAIAVFQDLNGNGELDERKNGIPKEPFGFSNDARGKFGPPKYYKAKFMFSGDMELNIKLVNNAKE